MKADSRESLVITELLEFILHFFYDFGFDLK